MNMRLFIRPTCLFLFLFFAISLSLQAADYRTWTDSTGKFQTEAMLLDFDGKTVKLKKKDDGKVISMALEKLSMPDRAEVLKLQAELAKAASENPFEGGTDSDDGDEDSGAMATLSLEPQPSMKPVVLRPDLAESIRMVNAATSWSIQADPGKKRQLAFKPKGMEFSIPKLEFGIHKTGESFFFCDDIPNRVLGVVHLAKRLRKTTLLFRGDLEETRARPVHLPMELVPYGLSPDGKRLLFHQKLEGMGFGNERLFVGIADVESPSFPCDQLFEPFPRLPKSPPSHASIRWGAWADNDHILVKAASGELLLFNWKTATPIWTCTISVNSKPLLSPGRKYLLVSGKNDGLYLMETISGNVVGRFAMPPGVSLSSATFAFSPDGVTLGALKNDTLYRWSTIDGQPRESLSTGTSRGRLQWIDDTYIMAGDVLLDGNENVLLRRYSGVAPSDQAYGGYYWIIRYEFGNNKNDNYELVPFVIPHVKIPPLKDIPDEQRYYVLPGMKVRLQVDDEIPESQKVRAFYREMAVKNGLTLVDDSPLVLAVRIKAQPAVAVKYANPLEPETTEKSTFTPHRMSVVFEKDGKVLWEQISTTSQPYLSPENIGDRSFHEVINERSQPTADWFLKISIPPKIPAARIGTSILSISGIREKESSAL